MNNKIIIETLALRVKSLKIAIKDLTERYEAELKESMNTRHIIIKNMQAEIDYLKTKLAATKPVDDLTNEAPIEPIKEG